jgi:hypothetical protein
MVLGLDCVGGSKARSWWRGVACRRKASEAVGRTQREPLPRQNKDGRGRKERPGNAGDFPSYVVLDIEGSFRVLRRFLLAGPLARPGSMSRFSGRHKNLADLVLRDLLGS